MFFLHTGMHRIFSDQLDNYTPAWVEAFLSTVHAWDVWTTLIYYCWQGWGWGLLIHPYSHKQETDKQIVPHPVHCTVQSLWNCFTNGVVPCDTMCKMICCSYWIVQHEKHSCKVCISGCNFDPVPKSSTSVWLGCRMGCHFVNDWARWQKTVWLQSCI